MVWTNNSYAAVHALAEKVVSEFLASTSQPPAVQRGPHHLCDVLAEEGFLSQNDTPLIDVGVGPSPHVAWNLLSHMVMGDLQFIECHPDWLAFHRTIYEQLKEQGACERPQLYHRWYLGNIYAKPHLLTGKKAIIHGELPRINEGVLPPKDLIGALGGIFDARPSQVALYLYPEKRSYWERPSRVLPVLDQLGVSYRRIDNVTSADFQPQPDGTLLLITP